jgi:small subunit ribosomal protein S5
MPKIKKKLEKDKEVIQEVLQEEEEREEEEIKEKTKEEKPSFDKEAWKPLSGLGKKVKAGEIKRIDEILDKGMRILEPEIVECLVPNLSNDLLLVGQSKGKFGGGRRRVFRQTQKKTREGNKPKFATVAIVGNNNGFVGLGYGKSKETVPAREKAIRNAKLNIIKIKRGCGSWQCGCKEPHTIPYAVSSKVGSTIIKLMPAPKGTGLVVEKECAKLLKAAGIKDVWSNTQGQTKTKINLVNACFDALKKLSQVKINPKHIEELGIVEGAIKEKEENE